MVGIGFNGGGGCALPNHEHTNIPLDGGPLDFINTTIASMNQGSITFSDGAALQELVKPAVPAGEVLTFPAAATAPSWQSSGGGGQTFTLIDNTAAVANGTTIDTTFTNIPGDDMSELYCVSAGSNGGFDFDMQIYDESTTLLTGANYTNHGYSIIGGVQTIYNSTGDTSANVVPGGLEPHLVIMHISLGRGGGAGANLYPRYESIAVGGNGVTHIGGCYITGAPRATGIAGIKFGVSASDAIENGTYLAIYQVKNV